MTRRADGPADLMIEAFGPFPYVPNPSPEISWTLTTDTIVGHTFAAGGTPLELGADLTKMNVGEAMKHIRVMFEQARL